ncbi:MAG: caspase family protein [Candidatus Hatepunaea meridiana]|nr:caspase family protein [Candidatus Hatepunaea meridiana]
MYIDNPSANFHEEVYIRLSSGQFYSPVDLVIGRNEILAEATDINYRKASKSFIIECKMIEFGTYHALFIAVDKYRSMNNLKYPVENANDIINTLTSKYTFDPKNVHLLKNPTRQEILSELQELRKLSSADNLLIFFAGHGYWDKDIKQGYWLPKNAKLNDRTNWLSNSTVCDYITGIKTRHTLLISDACFSGGIFKVRDPLVKGLPTSVRKTYETPSRRAITSGALKKVPDRSVFVEFMLERLKQNTERYLYAQKLYIEIKNPVIDGSPFEQTPLYCVIHGTGDQDGDFIFIKR